MNTARARSHRRSPPAAEPAVKSTWSPALSPQRWIEGALAAVIMATLMLPGESVAMGGQAVVQMLTAFVFLSWAVVQWFRPQPLRPWTRKECLIGLFLVLVVLSCLFSGPKHQRPALNSTANWMTLIVLFALTRQLFSTARQFRALLASLVACGSMLACFGIYQHQVTYPELRRAYQQDPVGTLQRAGLDPHVDSPQRKQFEDRLASTEPIATFALANSLAGFLLPLILVAASVSLTWGGRPPTPSTEPAASNTAASNTAVSSTAVSSTAASNTAVWMTRLAAGGGLLSMMVCLGLTKSRTAYLSLLLAMGASMVAWAWARRSRDGSPTGLGRARWIAAGLLLLAAATIPWVMGGVDRQVWSEAPKSLRYRLEYWQATTGMILDRPLWGTGPGGFQDLYTRYKLPQASETVADPHNSILEVWATCGSLACMVWAVLLLDRLIFRFPIGRPSLSDMSDQHTNSPELEAPVSRRVRQGESRSSKTSAALPVEPTPPVLGIYLGSLAGVLLAYPSGLVVGFLPDLDVLIMLPVAGLVLAGFHPWVERGSLPRRALWFGWSALNVNLLAAGGIAFPPLAILWWLWPIGFGDLGHGELNAAAGARDMGRRRLTLRWWELGAGILALMMVAGCYLGILRPIVRSRQATNLAFQANTPREVEGWLERSATADRWDRQPQIQLAEFRLQAWLRNPQAGPRSVVDESIQEVLRRDPVSSRARRRVGQWYRRIARVSNSPLDYQRSREAYQAATHYFPASSIAHVRLAWAEYLAGNPDQAAANAQRALELDQQHSHTEQKLANRRDVDEDAPRLPDGCGTAEQLAQWLRNR